MKFLKILGVLVAVVAVLFGGLFVGGYFIEPDVELSTEAMIEAPRGVVFDTLATQDGVVEWWTHAADTPLGADMPPMDVVAVDGPTEGKGTKIDFVVNGKSIESWEMLDSARPERVVWAVDFKVFEVTRTLTLSESDGGTKVVWSDTATLDNPFMRWMTLMPQDDIIKNFDGALLAAGEVAVKRAEAARAAQPQPEADPEGDEDPEAVAEGE